MPYAVNRTRTGSGAGVPLILKDKGLAEGEGEYGSCFNLVVKRGGDWLSAKEIESQISTSINELEHSQKNYVITKLNLGPTAQEAIPDSKLLEIMSRLTLPKNIKLNGVWAKKMDPEAPFVLSVIDIRGTKVPHDASGRINALLRNQKNSRATILSDSPKLEVSLSDHDLKLLSANYTSDGKSAARLLNYEQMQLSTAVALFIDEHSSRERYQQLSHWCQLYQIPVRTINASLSTASH